ncbi:20074_t:CDS:2, partial [Dentiscutata erythropus]
MGEEVKKLTPNGCIQCPAYNIVADISTSQDGSKEDVMFNYESNFVYANVENFDDNENIVNLTQNDDANMNNDSCSDNLYEGKDSRNKNSLNEAKNKDDWNKDKENDKSEYSNEVWSEDRSEYLNEDWNKSNVNNSSHSDEQFNMNKKDTYFNNEVDTYYDDE